MLFFKIALSFTCGPAQRTVRPVLLFGGFSCLR